RSDSIQLELAGQPERRKPAGLKFHETVVGRNPQRLCLPVAVKRDDRVSGKLLAPFVLVLLLSEKSEEGLVCRRPDAAVLRRGDCACLTRLSRSRRDRDDGVLREPVQAKRSADPDVALAILDE